MFEKPVAGQSIWEKFKLGFPFQYTVRVSKHHCGQTSGGADAQAIFGEFMTFSLILFFQKSCKHTITNSLRLTWWPTPSVIIHWYHGLRRISCCFPQPPPGRAAGSYSFSGWLWTQSALDSLWTQSALDSHVCHWWAVTIDSQETALRQHTPQHLFASKRLGLPPGRAIQNTQHFLPLEFWTMILTICRVHFWAYSIDFEEGGQKPSCPAGQMG